MKKKLRLWIALCAFVLCGCILISNNKCVSASTTTVNDFYFSDPNGRHVAESGNMDMSTREKDIYVTTEHGMNTTDRIDWYTSNSEIIDFAPDTDENDNAVTLVRKGPGYARITARITRGSVYYSISMLVKVEVKIKVEPDSISSDVTPIQTISTNNQKAIVLDYYPDGYTVPEGQQNNSSANIILQYTVNPEYVNNQLLTWTSEDDTVASVNAEGEVVAKGAGKTWIHITTNTNDNSESYELKVLVVVNPLVNSNVTDPDRNPNWTNTAVITGSSNFSIYTNAMKANKLTWTVTDSNNNVLSSDSNIINYVADPNTKEFKITNAKVGVYHISAKIADLEADANVVKVLDLTVIVPYQAINNITMNVTDTYDLVNNMNMSGNFKAVRSSDENILSVDQVTQVLTAKSTGTVTLTVIFTEYINGAYVDTTKEIIVNVIDALALNLSDATIYAGGQVKLDANVTDITAQLTWTSSNPSVATVAGGVVTGVTAGQTTITVSTTINGVFKSASCNILVVPEVTSIKIDPSDVSMSIGEYKTLNATITPASLNNVELKWISSNESIVQITENGKKYATIKAIAGGTAVITAINQNNVVVGFCNVTVKQPVTSITLSEKNVTISLADGSFQLRATVLPATATDQSLKYTSSNSSVVRVDDTGKVTLVGAGTASIIVTSVDNTSITDICNVTVTTPVTGVTLDTTALSMVVGETMKLTYTLIPTTATNKEVKWTSSDPAVCTVSSTGSVTAVKAGSSIVTITTTDGKYTKSCTVVVSQYASAIKLDKSELSLNVGDTHTIVVTTTPATSNDSITYETSNSTVATVSATGKITAVKEGTAIIIVKTNKGLTTFCNVTVKQKASGIELNYDKKTVVVTNTFTIKAVVLPVNASNQSVKFESSDTSIATVSDKGKVKGIKGGTAIITVTSVDGEYKATCVVTVKELVTGVTMTKSKKLGKGKSFQLVPKVTSTSATTTKLQWTSSNTKVAIVDKNGVVKAVGYGKATITAKATDGSGAKATCSLQVINPVKSISLNKSTLSIIEGDDKKLKATVNPSGATYKGVIWSSSDESIALVDSKGNVTAIKAGTVTIKATAKDGTKKSAKCIVTVVKKVPSTGVTVAEQTLVMVTGESKTVQAVMNPANTTDGYKWSSDNNAVATVNKSTGRIVAKAIGTATITVMTDSGKTARITVNVVGLSKTSLVLEQYTTHTLWVNGDANSVTWDIENPNIADISNGKVTARAIGSTNIIATVNGRRLYCKLTVTKIK